MFVSRCIFVVVVVVHFVCLFHVENSVISFVSELFRCRTRGTEYGFDYTLFGDLVPEKCRVMVHPTEVILSLAKREKGMWSRLLKEKHKVSKHLSVLLLSLSFLSSVRPSEHQCINLSSVLFQVVHSLSSFFLLFLCGGFGWDV